MSTASGRGDPARTLELLWRRPATRRSRGPRPALTVDRIVQAGVTVADAEGIDAVSMRRLAADLRVGVMSLYTYVPGKAELVDLMLDAVYGEPTYPAPGPGWRAALTQVAQENRALYRRHPWLLDVATGRPVAGPNETAKYDAELRALAGTGLTDVQMDAALRLVLGHTQAAARAAVQQEQLTRDTGLTDAQWWRRYGPLLTAHVDPDRFPTAARVGAAVGAAFDAAFDPGYVFQFGLERILDGIEDLLDRADDAGPPAR